MQYVQTDIQAGRQTDRQTDIQTGRQTDRQTDRQTGRQTGRQANRQETGNLPAMVLVSVMPGMPTIQLGSPFFQTSSASEEKMPCSTGLVGQQLLFKRNPKGLVTVRLVRLGNVIEKFSSSSYCFSRTQKDPLSVAKAVGTSSGHLKSFTAFCRRTFL